MMLLKVKGIKHLYKTRTFSGENTRKTDRNIYKFYCFKVFVLFSD